MKTRPFPDSLRSRLRHEPQPLQFGTSGRRGLLMDLSQLEVFINGLAELEYLQSLPREEGGIVRGEDFYFGYDLRPSSSRFVEGEPRRGELAQAIEYAIECAGMRPVNMGRIPTPALMHYAVSRGRGSIMVTGSHIPFDRNGYKTNTSRGELLKPHEGPINEKVGEVRERTYRQPFADSPFDEDGLFKDGHRDLSPESDVAAKAYLSRYRDFFGAGCLAGTRLLVYQHSAVGRDLLVEILRAVGAEVFVGGRSEVFVPIDTENIGAEQLAAVQSLFDQAIARHGPIDAVVSTDGDSDRPLILGVDDAGRVRFFGGDLVGMITAEYLGADAAVVPISCNDAIDRGILKSITEPKTRIGSPYVIAGMEAARARGQQAVCGWEANGGFLTGSDISLRGRTLSALPTRDAVLPILAVLSAASEQGIGLTELFARLPKRYSRAALLKQFPRSIGLAIVRRFSPADSGVGEVRFTGDSPTVLDTDGRQRHGVDDATLRQSKEICDTLSRFFTSAVGFGTITAINYVDGVRIVFDNGDVAHLRPSGNADELRIYAVADSRSRAEAIAALAVAEPDGILRRLEGEVRRCAELGR